LHDSDWANTTVLRGDLETEIRLIKDLPGGDLMVYGSADLVTALLELDLRDPTAWLLGPDGKYARPAAAVGDPASAQQTLLDEIVP
jgi:hypothetical protein